MTIPASPRKAGPFIGNSAQTVFPFEFKVYTTEEVKVVRAVLASGAETILTLDSDYSVTLNVDQEADPGGEITYPIIGTALPATQSLTAVGDLTYEQQIDLPDGGSYDASDVEAMGDRLGIQAQQLDERLARAVMVPVSSTTDPQDLITELLQASDDAVMAAAAAAVSQGAASASAVDAAASVVTAGNSATAANASAVAAAASAAVAAAVALDTPLTGLSLVTGGAITAANTILEAFGKLQKQVTDLLTAVGLKADDNVVVKMTGAQTIAGVKTFSSRPVVPARSSVRVNTTNGNGSTNTVIRRWTNVVENTGSDITYADSATLGGSFTINTTGTYAINYNDAFSASADQFTASKNSAQLTTAAASITVSTKLGNGYSPSADIPATAGGTYNLTAGDVIRAHANTGSSSAPDRCQFTITGPLL